MKCGRQTKVLLTNTNTLGHTRRHSLQMCVSCLGFVSFLFFLLIFLSCSYVNYCLSSQRSLRHVTFHYASSSALLFFWPQTPTLFHTHTMYMLLYFIAYSLFACTFFSLLCSARLPSALKVPRKK